MRGRIGSPGQVRIAMHESENAAQEAFDKKRREKQRKGYG
jgi:predicted DNA-binding WGR domain protein